MFFFLWDDHRRQCAMICGSFFFSTDCIAILNGTCAQRLDLYSNVGGGGMNNRLLLAQIHSIFIYCCSHVIYESTSIVIMVKRQLAKRCAKSSGEQHRHSLVVEKHVSVNIASNMEVKPLQLQTISMPRKEVFFCCATNGKKSKP